ncbi:amine sulfotransferase-like [Hyperolius riggenbachi]|uniref:amine sulfotransferase-like n=1 Tax=Hyperolius riggenbachi TaxID=752182 RepID=UPI0035A3C2AC
MAQEALQEALEAFLLKHKGMYFHKGITSPEVIDAVEHMETRNDDVFLVTYPKSGTIWTQQILGLIFSEQHRNGKDNTNNMDRAPWIEYNEHNIVFDNRPSPRLFTSHLPYYLMPKDLRHRRGKIIYVCRNPKDSVVSYYHFYKIYTKLQCTIDWKTFFDLFMTGRVIGGSWSDHIRGWYTHKEDYNILFMTYEEMRKDLKSAVLKICKFVGKILNDQEVETVVERATFKNMEHDPVANYKFLTKNLFNFDRGNFLRKGTIGDWKNLMTVAQSEQIDEMVKSKLGDLPIKFVWDIDDEPQ